MGVAPCFPHLPCSAVEAIQRCIWSDDCVQGLDSRRYVLPLVNKQWKKCLELAPDAWQKVTISNVDLTPLRWPSSEQDSQFNYDFAAVSSRVQAWFEKHGRSIQSLSINLNSDYLSGTLEEVECMLLGLLRAVQGTLQHLSLRVAGAPLLAAKVWLHLSEGAAASGSTLWHYLETLDIKNEGNCAEGTSEAKISATASAVLCTLPSIPSLKIANISLVDVKLYSIPAALREATQLEELSLEFASTKSTDILKQAILLPLATTSLLDFRISEPLDQNEESLESINETLRRLAVIKDLTADAVRTLFYTSSFQTFAETLLSVVAPDWLPRFPDEETKQNLFYRWFHEAPSVPLLRCLSWHLASVEPLPHSTRPVPFQRALVLPISAEIAGELLIARFAVQGSSGVADILSEGVSHPEIIDDLAGLIAGIPDRAVLLPECIELHPAAFVPYLTSQIIDYVISNRTGVVMGAEVLSKVVLRGHAALLATALLSTEKFEIIGALLEQFPASMALEKLVEAMIRALPDAMLLQTNQNISSTSVLGIILPQTLWLQRSEVRLLLQDKLLTQKVMSSGSLTLVLDYLDWLSCDDSTRTNTIGTGGDILADTAWRAASVWGTKSTVQRVPTPQQDYMTAAVCGCLQRLGKARFEAHPGLTAAILQGISTRLDSPIEWVRREAMRVGNDLSLTLDPSAVPLFGTENLNLLSEEKWEQEPGKDDTSAPLKENKIEILNQRDSRSTRQKKDAKKERPDDDKDKDGDKDGYPLTETDSDDDLSSDSEFEQYDLNESDEEISEISTSTTLQLRDLITMLQKGDSDWKGHLKALRSAETLIRAAPDELTHYAVPLARALLFARVPEWADEESPSGEDPLEDQRFRSLVALTVAAPEPVGLQLAADVYSPSMDVQQRSRALAVLGTAAEELASPGSVLKPLPGTEEGPRNKGNAYLEQGASERKAGKVVRASERSLAAHNRQEKASTGSSKQPHANRFPPIALKWAAALLKECDVRHHGVDLFGRDYFILGRLLATLGSFLEATRHSPEAVPLTTAVLELIKAQHVHDSEEPYVRRAALMAASHALMAVPPAAIATSLLPQELGAQAHHQSPVVERLEWLRGWVEETAAQDPDKNCRMMGAACRGLHGALSAEAIASLAEGAGGLLGDGGVSPMLGGVGPKINVTLPSIQNLSLG